MGLTATVQAGIDTAFAQAGDLVGEIWLTRESTGTFNPATGDVTSVEVEFSFDGIIDTRKKAGSFGSSDNVAAGADINRDSVLVYLKPADDVVPEVGDVLRINESKLRISSVNPVMPDGVTVLLWELEAVK